MESAGGEQIIVIDNGEDSAEGMEQYLREGASGSLAETFGGYVVRLMFGGDRDGC